MATATFYPTIDGYAERTSQAILSTLITGAGEGSNAGGDDIYIALAATSTNNQYNVLRRCIFIFDTSGLPDSAIISSAVFSIYGSTDTISKIDQLSQSLCIVQNTPNSDTNIVNSDYDSIHFGLVEWASRMTITSFDTAGYNDFNLNAAAIAVISKTGYTRIGIRLSGDVDNSVTWVSNNTAAVGFYAENHTGTDKDPKLVITYTLPNSNFLNFM